MNTDVYTGADGSIVLSAPEGLEGEAAKAVLTENDLVVVGRVQNVRVTGDPVVRPEGFDLAEAWRMISAQVDQLRTPARARAAVHPDYVHMLRWILGTQLKVGPARPEGRIDVELAGQNEERLARELAGFGAGLEILEPQSMRDLLVQIADELRATYS